MARKLQPATWACFTPEVLQGGIMSRQSQWTVGATVVASLVLASVVVAVPAAAQEQRMRAYRQELETRVEKKLDDFRKDALRRDLEEHSTSSTQAELEQAGNDDVAQLQAPFPSVVNVYDSNDGNGQDVEIRLTMPIDLFMEFAPIAALEAAAVTHKFPVVYIFLREETTDRVARVAFRDAEPIAGRYLAGDKNAVKEMKDALIWH
jgi:hypothetical protein